MGFGSELASALFGTPSPSQKKKSPGNDFEKTLDLKSGAYYVNPKNWYTAKPYGFRWHRRDGQEFTMFLPISPSNINISTPFATNIIPTLYGTVEEHSDIRYYDIVIEGTTGMTPKFVSPINTTDDITAYQTLLQPGRATFPIRNAILGGFLSSTVAQIQNISNQVNKVVSAITGSSTSPETAVYVDQTGYLAFHNLYRFLKQYKRDVAGVESNTAFTQHPLKFFNYKDNNEYNVAIRNFTLRKSAENPMLYYYSITMRGYNLNTVGGETISDDFAQRLSDLGLDGVKSSSLLSKIKDVSSGAKAIVGSVLNGKNLLGR